MKNKCCNSALHRYDPEKELFYNTRISFWALFLITVTSFIAFPGLLRHDFVSYDDGRIIKERVNTYDGITLDNIKSITLTDFPREEPLIVRDYSYLINAQIFGVLNPGGYLIGNITLHILVSYLVYCLVIVLFPGQHFTAILSALLFTIHPLHVESVAWISSRKDPLYSAFYLGALLQLHSFLKKQRLLSLLFSYLLFIGALFSKAAAISFLPTALCLWYCIKKKSSIKIAEFVYFLIIAISTFLFIKWYTNILHSYGVIHNTVNTGRDWLLWGLSSCEYIRFYIEKLIFPINLTIAYDYPAPHLIYTHQFSLFIAIISIITSTALLLIAHSRRHYNILFIGCFFFCALFPYLDLAQVNIYVADRYAYLASVSFCILLSLGFVYFYKYLKENNSLLTKPFILALIIYTSFYLFQARTANKVWRNTFTLWQNAYQLDSHRPDVYTGLIGQYIKFYVNNLGQPSSYDALERAKQLGEEAVHKFCRTDDTCPPQVFKILASLGEIYWQQKNADKAKKFFQKSIKLNPDYPESRFMYLSLLIEQGEYELAAEQTRLCEEKAHPFLDRKLLNDIKNRIWPIINHHKETNK